MLSAHWSPATVIDRDESPETADAMVTLAIKEAVAHLSHLGQPSVTLGTASPALVAWAEKRRKANVQIEDGDRPVKVWSERVGNAWVCIQSRPGEEGWKP